MRMTTQLKSVMKRNLTQLMSNSVTLEAPGPTGVTLVNGTPMEEQTLVAHWVGKGSIQYVRPRIQKAFADEMGGTMEDPVGAVVYLPYESLPEANMMIVDTDGILGDIGAKYVQSREPANVGGASVYWECYIGKQVNA